MGGGTNGSYKFFMTLGATRWPASMLKSRWRAAWSLRTTCRAASFVSSFNTGAVSGVFCGFARGRGAVAGGLVALLDALVDTGSVPTTVAPGRNLRRAFYRLCTGDRGRERQCRHSQRDDRFQRTEIDSMLHAPLPQSCPDIAPAPCVGRSASSERVSVD